MADTDASIIGDECISHEGMAAEHTSNDECASDEIRLLVKAEQVNDCSMSCDCIGCTNGMGSPTLKTFQPKEPAVLCTFERNGRKFLAAWYEKYPWLTCAIPSHLLEYNADLPLCFVRDVSVIVLGF